MTALLDVNVLVALAWPNHVHHLVAHRWFAARGKRSWATCPLTESSFVRVSSNPAATAEARSPAEAIQLLRLMVARPGHVFWADDVSIASSELASSERLVGHRQVTDAHLLALAHRHGGRLATFDRRLLRLVPAGWDEAALVELID